MRSSIWMAAESTTQGRTSESGLGSLAVGSAAGSIRVLVTGPDIVSPGGAGVQQHVRYLLASMEHSSLVELQPFNATSVHSQESLIRKGSRLIARWTKFPMQARSYDIVHVNASIDTKSLVRDLGFVLLAKMMRRAVVLQFHGGGIHRARWVGRQPWRLIAGGIMRQAETCLFLSEGQESEMIATFGLERVARVRNYVDVDGVSPNCDVEPGTLRVLHIGRLVPTKGVRLLLSAMKRPESAAWQLRIAGTGELEDEVLEAAQSNDCITYLGHIDGTGKTQVFEWADIVALPTSHDEGLPYTLLEGAAAGCALVSTRRGAIDSICRDERNGLLVEEGDVVSLSAALTRLARNPDLLRRMKLESRRVAVSEFSFSAMTKTFEDIYTGIAKSSESGHSGL